MLDTTIEQEASTIMFFNLSGATDWRIRRLEKKIDLILQHLGIEYEEESFEERLKYLISIGHTVAAIKELRKQNGSSLREAKETIEAMEKEMREPFR